MRGTFPVPNEQHGRQTVRINSDRRYVLVIWYPSQDRYTVSYRTDNLRRAGERRQSVVDAVIIDTHTGGTV